MKRVSNDGTRLIARFGKILKSQDTPAARPKTYFNSSTTTVCYFTLYCFLKNLRYSTTSPRYSTKVASPKDYLNHYFVLEQRLDRQCDFSNAQTISL